jgi:ATP-dependent helicase HrpB
VAKRARRGPWQTGGVSTFPLEAIAAGLPAAGLIPPLRRLAETGGSVRAVVDAPPGTGKTTVVPPLLAQLLAGRAGTGSGPGEGSAAGSYDDSPAGPPDDSSRGASDGSAAHARAARVVVAQPRRIAARSAAHRLAQLSGLRLGEEVGYTVRGERRAGPRTAVEFVTTGVLLRRLVRDPELAGVACVVMDEVHERHLDADLAFGMLRQLAELREDLWLVAMSATLDAPLWARLLGTEAEPAPVAAVEAAPHPLEVRWAPPARAALDARGVTRDFLAHVAATVLDDVEHRSPAETGDLLVFLPGAREIDAVASRLSGRPGLEVHSLSGRTPPEEQRRILAPRPGDGPRRAILATNVAESALTVPGVRTVVDAGLDRQQRLDTVRGMSGLVTVGASKAAMTQRAGRAAREAPGTVIRCLAQSEHAARPAATPPEIVTSDLTTAMLDLACWGAPGGAGLRLPDPPPGRALAGARAVLRALGALDDADRATPLGRRLAAIPADPRLARALFDGAELLGPRAAAETVAALSSERRAPGSDAWALLRELRRSRDERWRQDVRRFGRELAAAGDGRPAAASSSQSGADRLPGAPAAEAGAGLVTALAFPERIARLRRGSEDEYLLASGSGAVLPRESALKGHEWLAVAEIGLSGGKPLIRCAAVVDQDTAELAGSELLVEEEDARFDGKVTSRDVRRLGAIELSSTPRRPSPAAGRRAVAAALQRDGLEAFLRPGPEFGSLRGRLGLLRAVYGEPWPDVRLPALEASAEDWIGPELERIAEGGSRRGVDAASALRRLLPWPEAARLEELVPERLRVPSGSSVRLTWPAPEEHGDDVAPPVLAVKLQECFGWAEGPAVCEGRVPVLLHLLSPARRPLAVTADLASFWANAYPGVRAENRGRYIKHPWPEDPWSAPPTARTKARGG